MSLTVSPQIRIVALVGALAAAGLAVFMFTMRSPASSVDAAALPKIKPLYGGRKVAAHPKTTHAKTAAKAAPAAKHVVPPPERKPAPKAPPVAANGLPAMLVTALARHPVVVVALYDPQARVDGISLAEAQAGATAAGAGFVPLDVLDASQVGPLMRQLGVLPDPAVLVYRRPGDLVTRFDGFADRDTVAQAATNASPDGLARQVATEAATPVVTREAWARRAGKLCSTTWANAPKIDSTAPRAKFMKWAPGALARQQRLIGQLAALPLPTHEGDRVLANRLLSAARRFHATDSALFLALERNDRAATLRLLNVEVGEIAQANAAARAVGATGCAVFDK
jgi:hypothetical protein